MPLHPVYNDTGPDVSNKKRQTLAQSCAGIAGLTAGPPWRRAGARAHGQKRDQRPGRPDRTWDCRRLAGKGGDKGRPGQSGSETGVPTNWGEVGGEPLRDAKQARTRKPAPGVPPGGQGTGLHYFCQAEGPEMFQNVSGCFRLLGAESTAGQAESARIRRRS